MPYNDCTLKLYDALTHNCALKPGMSHDTNQGQVLGYYGLSEQAQQSLAYCQIQALKDNTNKIQISEKLFHEAQDVKVICCAHDSEIMVHAPLYTMIVKFLGVCFIRVYYHRYHTV